MGHVYVDARVSATRGSRKIRFMIDTGASFALLPRSIADAIGVLPLPKKVPTALANGARQLLPVGTFVIELLGRTAPVTTFILPDRKNVEPLLGVESLEGLGLAVDPSSGQLKPTRARAVMLVGIRTPR
jgi:aspartyl protease family protein